MLKTSRNPELLAHIAATLLTGRGDAETHHIKAAVGAAKRILDEALLQAVDPAEEDDAPTQVDEPAADPAPEQEQDGSTGETDGEQEKS